MCATYTHHTIHVYAQSHTHISPHVIPPSFPLCRNCPVCRQPFSDAAFVRYPNGTVTHLRCARNKSVCPITGTWFGEWPETSTHIALDQIENFPFHYVTMDFFFLFVVPFSCWVCCDHDIVKENVNTCALFVVCVGMCARMCFCGVSVWCLCICMCIYVYLCGCAHMTWCQTWGYTFHSLPPSPPPSLPSPPPPSPSLHHHHHYHRLVVITLRRNVYF